MAFLPVALAVAGPLLEGFGQWQSAKYQQAVARNNEQLAKDQAGKEAEAAQLQSQRSDYEYAALLGTQLATQSASGLDVLGKSQLRIRESTRQQRELAAQDIRKEGANKIEGLLQEAANFKGQAHQAGLSAGLAVTGSVLKAGSSAINADPKLKKSLIGETRSTGRYF